MSDLRKPSRGLAGLLAAALLGGFLWSMLTLGLPTDRVPRETLWLASRAAAVNLDVRVPAASNGEVVSSAAVLCEAYLGVSIGQADCGMGRLLETGASPEANPEALRAGLQRAQRGLARYEALRSAVLDVSSGHLLSHWMVGLVDQRIERIRVRTQDASPGYVDLFHALLLAEGVRYNSLSGEFSSVRWDLARVIDAPERRAAQARRRPMAISLMPSGLALLGGLAGWLVWRRLGWPAFAAAAGLLSVVAMGLLVMADAGLRFGEGALGFALNPFTYALPRQLIVVVGALACFMGCLLAARPISQALEWLSNRLGLAALLGAAIVPLFYAAISPAAGSESLKIWVCGLAGLVVVRYARQAYLAREVLEGFMSVGGLVRALFGTAASPSAARDIHRHFLRAFGGVFLLALVVVGAAAVAFKDFGGALISAAVFLALIFIIFGWRFLALAMGLGVVLSAAAMLTERVMGRLLLMLEPMQAAVSDFARLIKFAEGGQPGGYGLGQIQWCSHEGACLPLQSLSDYLPTILLGLFGDRTALLLLALVLMVYGLLLIVAVRGLAMGLRQSRALYAIGFFLLMASAIQTVVTGLGNLRLIPLTGLGLPLMSLGLSSFLSVAVGFGLLAGASAQSSQGRRP
ncbi:MAG: FtsW/RodA/SpoVE family cell cycle protein [Burkholderiaceae bacterium]